MRTIFHFLQQYWSWALDLFYPRDCVICGNRVTYQGYLCPTCRNDLWPERHAKCDICGIESPDEVTEHFTCPACRQHPPAFIKAFVALRYIESVKELILAFKYSKCLWLVGDFVYYLQMIYVNEILAQGISIDGIVPIPMTLKKRRYRGYNQAEILAKELAKRVGVPCYSKWLSRTASATWSQARLQRKDRLVNAKRIYHLRKPLQLKGKTLLLVDDVMTTGATVNACASLLKACGANVYVLVLARPFFA